MPIWMQLGVDSKKLSVRVWELSRLLDTLHRFDGFKNEKRRLKEEIATLEEAYRLDIEVDSYKLADLGRFTRRVENKLDKLRGWDRFEFKCL